MRKTVFAFAKRKTQIRSGFLFCFFILCCIDSFVFLYRRGLLLLRPDTYRFIGKLGFGNNSSLCYGRTGDCGGWCRRGVESRCRLHRHVVGVGSCSSSCRLDCLLNSNVNNRLGGDEGLITETAVWPNFFLMNVFFALKGSKLFILSQALCNLCKH